jgi:ribosome recycling factor
MEPTKIISNTQDRFDQAIERFKDGLKTLRTGRASVAMLDGVMVEVYGTSMPLNQTATVSVPESQLIQIKPFDPNNLQAIAEAIRNNQSLGLNPSDDGHVVRVPIPPLNEERRLELAKQIGQKQEECMIILRNIRHDAMDNIDKAKKDKQIGEDEASRLASQIEEFMNRLRGEAEAAAKAKETEIMTV